MESLYVSDASNASSAMSIAAPLVAVVGQPNTLRITAVLDHLQQQLSGSVDKSLRLAIRDEVEAQAAARPLISSHIRHHGTQA